MWPWYLEISARKLAWRLEIVLMTNVGGIVIEALIGSRGNRWGFVMSVLVSCDCFSCECKRPLSD